MSIPKIGDEVSYKAAGKVRRLESMAGKVVKGKVTHVDEERKVCSVMPYYRTLPGAMNKDMGASIDFDQIIKPRRNRPRV